MDRDAVRARLPLVVAVLAGLALAACCATRDPAAVASTAGQAAAPGGEYAPAEVCGPQTPRDISVAGGTNRLPVPGDGQRPPRFCAMHFHQPAEHTGISACPTVRPGGEGVCDDGGRHRPVRAGDEIEVHWVYTNCPPFPEPKPGLDNCVCRSQTGPDPMVLMVFAQKYVVAPDGTSGAADRLVEPTGDLARFGGSTTGPSYSDGSPGDPRPCSAARVQWQVDRQCRALQVSALGTWCETNPWGERHAEGSRGVITRQDWLAPYVP